MGSPIDLRLGRWQDVLSDVTSFDCLIADPPYGARTHDGNKDRLASMGREPIGYDPFTEKDIDCFVGDLSPRCRGWFCAMTSDDMIPVWRNSYKNNGRYDFAPVPVLAPRLRMSGDGPASSAVYLMVSRPRSSDFMGWGSLPGWYETNVERGACVIGAKPISLMRAIIRDYTKPGDLIVDPCAGGATTLIAAAMEGRRAIGAEMSEETYKKAIRRINGGYTTNLPGVE